MLVKITETCRYAHPEGPHMPQIDFVEGSVADVHEKLGASIVSNEHGHAVEVEAPETAVVEAESKDDGLEVESKDETGAETSDDSDGTSAYDALPPKKQLFVDEYLIDSNGAAAAIRAGYSQNTAETRAAGLLRLEEVKAAVKEKTR